jgi:hypothetical protein
MSKAHFIKSAARGEQLLKLVGKLAPGGKPPAPGFHGGVKDLLARRILLFPHINTGGRPLEMTGSVWKAAPGQGGATSKAYYDSVFGEPKQLGKTFTKAMESLSPESQNLNSLTMRSLLENLANRQPLRDAMAKNVKNYRRMSRQGAKKAPKPKSETIATP